MSLETYLVLDITVRDSEAADGLIDWLERELARFTSCEAERRGENGISLRGDGFPADVDSSGIGFFGEVEKFLLALEKRSPGFKGHGHWTVDFTVADDAPPECWEFDWSDGKVANVVDPFSKK